MGLSRNAQEKEIKRAFKRLSLIHHPDKNPNDDTALKKFQDISAAYEVLSDSDKRRKYDQCGEKCVNEQGMQQGGSPFGDIFGDFFGGGQRQQQERTGPSMTIKLKVSLEDLYTGKDMQVKYTRNTICPHCRGSGADDPNDVKTCTKCNGQGMVIETRRIGPGFVQQFQTQCNQCGGKGKEKTSTCHYCRGANVKQALDEIYVYIEKGSPDGHEERFRDAADEHVDQKAGDVIFKLQQLEHDRFERIGDDLKTSINITLKQALLGFEKQIIHLDGHEVKIERKFGQVTQPGEIIRIRDEGMPKYGMTSEAGDLLVTVHVNSPTQLDQEQRTKLKELFLQN